MGLELAEPCKSRLFPPLTVHSRPPFPFTFFFLPPVNSGGAIQAVFAPVGLWYEHAAADCTAFHVPRLINLRFQRPIQRQDCPAELLTADGERNHLRTGAGVAIVKGDTGNPAENLSIATSRICGIIERDKSKNCALQEVNIMQTICKIDCSGCTFKYNCNVTSQIEPQKARGLT